MKKQFAICAVILTAILGVSCNKEQPYDPYTENCFVITTEYVIGKTGDVLTSIQYFWGTEYQLEVEKQIIKESIIKWGVPEALITITSSYTPKSESECK